jgi:hypothetical protein
MNITEILHNGLCNHKIRQTKSILGDRSRYIGMSDIGKAAECLRAATADKLRTEETPGTLQRELLLGRGHWFETGVFEAFRAAEVPFFYQLYIKCVHDGIPIIAHPDFVFVGEDIHLIELKSCGQVPDSAYAAHETQLYGQMSMLRFLWNDSSFGLPTYSGEYSFEKLTHQHLGVMPDKTRITGSILYISMKEVKIFGPYEPNDIMLKVCFDLAGQIWNNAQRIKSGAGSLNDLPIVGGRHPLCDYCDWNADCPRFAGVNAPDLEADLVELQALKDEREKIAGTIKEREEDLKTTFHRVSPAGDWINALTMRYRVAFHEGRKSLDKEQLLSALTSRLPGEPADKLIAAGMKSGSGYERLYIGNINTKEI